ncbi:MAG: ankyrin repeat domain-containing protein [Planctomycetota bacterium]
MDVRLPIAEEGPLRDPLVAAIHAGALPRVREMIEAEPRRLHHHVAMPVPGAEPPREELWLPLHHAAALGDAAMVAVILSAGGHPDARTRAASPDHARATALHLASAGGHAAVVGLLLDADAEPNVLDAHGTTPLAAANDPTVVGLLGAAGADPSAGAA